METGQSVRRMSVWLRARAVLATFVALPLLAGCLADSNHASGSVMASAASSSATPAAPLSVVASVQDARGKSEKDINPEFAKRLEEASAREIRQKTVAILKEHKLPPIEPTIRSESSVVQKGGRKLAYISMELDGRSRAVEVVGIKGKEMQRIFCFRDSLEEIAVADGACGDKVAEVFKVRLAR